MRNRSLFEAALSDFLCRCEVWLKRPINSSETYSKAGASETRCTQLDGVKCQHNSNAPAPLLHNMLHLPGTIALPPLLNYITTRFDPSRACVFCKNVANLEQTLKSRAVTMLLRMDGWMDRWSGIRSLMQHISCTLLTSQHNSSFIHHKNAKLEIPNIPKEHF